MTPADTAPVAPARLLVCECAGTMASNVDFGVIERELAAEGAVERHRVWCGAEGQARLAELAEDDSGERLVFVGCSADSVAQRFGRLVSRGLELAVADVREGCSWVHGDDRAKVTDKALRIARAAVRFPVARAEVAGGRDRVDSVVVVGGGVAGIATATELARMGHHVDLVERQPFLGGWATRIGTAYPTNDCGACLPTVEEQSGVRRCLFRNAAVDHPNLAIWRRTEVESVSGEPGGFEVTLRQLPNMVTQDCVDCGLCEKACAVTARTAALAIPFPQCASPSQKPISADRRYTSSLGWKPIPPAAASPIAIAKSVGGSFGPASAIQRPASSSVYGLGKPSRRLSQILRLFA